MGQLSPKLRNSIDNGLSFWCPGCNGPHRIQHGAGAGPRWGWNGDSERPVFTPSVLVTWTEPANIGNPEAMKQDLAEAQCRRDAGEQNVRVPQADKVCHSFVGCNGAQPGQIIFLGDSTHAMAGQTVELADWPAGWGD